jgi:hypothetical protein
MRTSRSLLVISMLAALTLVSAPSRAAAAPAPPRADSISAPKELSVNYDVVEEVATLLTANFDTDMAALTSAKGVTALAAVTIHKRLPAVIFAGDEVGVPGLGIYAPRTVTNAKSQGKRECRVTCVVELFIRGATAATVRAQAELGLEAILKTVDRVADAGSGVFGAGEEEAGVFCEIDGAADAKGGQEQYEEVARVRFIVWDQDTV